MFVCPPVCVWLKRDLRVVDHPALATTVERSQGGAVFAAFLYEPEIDAPRVAGQRNPPA
jgi:deoxyribodipyrimidine photolyase